MQVRGIAFSNWSRERERDKRGKSGRAREKNVGLPEAYHLDAPNPQLQTKKSSQC